MVDTASPLLSATCCSVRPRSLRALRSLAPTSCLPAGMAAAVRAPGSTAARTWSGVGRVLDLGLDLGLDLVRGLGMKDRKSTRLNSSHLVISYAVFCLKKKK